MSRKIDEAIELLDLNELVKVKRDIDAGGDNLNRLLKAKIKKELKKHDRFCCVCNARIDPNSVSNFTLIFGPEDMKKKASFCALDCLEYFISNLKDFWGTESQTFIKNKSKKKNRTMQDR